MLQPAGVRGTAACSFIAHVGVRHFVEVEVLSGDLRADRRGRPPSRAAEALRGQIEVIDVRMLYPTSIDSLSLSLSLACANQLKRLALTPRSRYP